MNLSESSKRLINEQNDPDIIGRHAAAAILGITVRTLQRWHLQEIGPRRKRWWKRERPIRYSKTEVEQWAASYGSHHDVTSTTGMQLTANGHSAGPAPNEK